MSPEQCWFEEFGCIIDGQGAAPSDLTRDDVFPLLQKYGAILLKNFDVDLAEFKSLTDRCCLKYMTHMGVALRGRLAGFERDDTLTEVTQGENDLALHGEMYHSPGAPEVIWFFCQTVAPAGGATTLADAGQLYDELSPDLRKKFHATRIKYLHIDPPLVWRPRYGVESVEAAASLLKASEGVSNLSTDENGNIIYDYITSAIRTAKYGGKAVFINNIFITRNPANRLREGMLPGQAKAPPRAIEVEWEDGSPLSDDVLREVFDAGSRITKSVDWEPGCVVMVDNTRILHGRRAFQGKRLVATRIASVA